MKFLKLSIIILFAAISLKAQSLPDSCKYSRAWYDVSVIQDYPLLKTLPKGMSIIVDTALKPVNFMSQHEEYMRFLYTGAFDRDKLYREIRDSLDKFDYSSIESLDSFPRAMLTDADKIHARNNNHEFVVSIINNSGDTVILPSQDGSIMAIREAKDKKGKWRPIEYWSYSGCGNSYLDVRIPPGKSVQFPANKNTGDFTTKVRFKIIGKDSFLYSNEFVQRIPSCLLKNPVTKGGPYHDNFFTKFHKIDTMRGSGNGNIYLDF